MKNHSFSNIRAVIALGACFLATHAVYADGTWNGNGSAPNWSISNNWVGGSQPSYGTLTFNTSNNGYTMFDDNITSMNQLYWSGTNAWTLNQGGSTVLSLYDNGGTQAKVENQSTGLVTINLPITFAATSGAAWGEINAVHGDLTFGSGTLTVNGSSVNGIKLYGGGHTTTFNNTVSASGKWFGLTAVNTTMAVGGAFTSGDIYVMNSGTLQVNAGGTVNTTAVRLGGDLSTTGSQNLALGGTLQLTNLTGGQTFGSLINTVSNNTSGTLLVNSLNTSGTNTLSSNISLNSGLTIQNSAGGTLNLTGTTDFMAQTLTFKPSGTMTASGALTSTLTAGGSLIKSGSDTLILQNTSNSYSGTNSNSLNANSTQISAGTLGIYGDGSLGVAPAGAYNNIQFTGSGTLQDTVNNISLNANRNISIASGATATFDTNGNTFTIPGQINTSSTSATNLVATGGGKLILQNTSNTYTGTVSTALGTTTITGNTTLGIYGDQSLGSVSNTAFNNIQFTGSGTLQDTANNISLNANRNISIAGGATASLDSNGNTLTINSVINGTGGAVSKVSTGTVTLANTNTYSGGTTVTAGTLSLGAAGADGSGSLTVGSGGTVTITAGSAINNAGAVKLSGGTIANADTAANGSRSANSAPTNNTQTLGVLTLNGGTSILDFGAGNTGAIFNFADSHTATWAAGSILNVYDWQGNYPTTYNAVTQQGTVVPGGLDQLFFGGSNTGLTQTQLQDIHFFSGYGTGELGNGISIINQNGDVSPAPEPGQVAVLSMIGLGIGGLLLRARKRSVGEATS